MFCAGIVHRIVSLVDVVVRFKVVILLLFLFISLSLLRCCLLHRLHQASIRLIHSYEILVHVVVVKSRNICVRACDKKYLSLIKIIKVSS